MQLDHVNIHADDREAMRDFLVALLGLEVGWRPGFVEPGYWLYLEGKPVLHIWPRSRPHGHGWVDHIAFGPCGAAGAKRAELREKGFTFSEARLPDTDIVQFFVSGPEGVKIELQCR